MNKKYSSLLSLLVVPAFFVGCAKKEEAVTLIRPVRTMIIEDAGAFGKRRVFPGRAEAVQSVDIAFEVQGQLIERPVKVGEVVKTGVMLAKLDQRDYKNDVDSAIARLARAKAYLSRIDQAAKTGAVAEQDLTDAQAQYDVADANLKVKQKAFTDTQILAPFDGTIAALYVENFQNVRAKENVVRLLDMSEIEFKINIPEAYITEAKQIEDVTVTYDTFPGRPVSATIKEIGTEASKTTRSYPVTMVMKQPKDFFILPGMTGQARGRSPMTDLRNKELRLVETSAVFTSEKERCVWVVDDETLTVKRTKVETRDVGEDGILVTGLETGQRVVTAGVHSLSEGQKVRLLKTATEKEL